MIKSNPKEVFNWVKNNNLRERPFILDQLKVSLKAKSKK